MSGSGGYYRYHCKNWMTYDCQNWVWMNNTPCANCVANGRDAEDSTPVGFLRLTWETKAPLIQNGSIRYLSSEESAAMETNHSPHGEDSELELMTETQVSTSPVATSGRQSRISGA